MKNIRILPVFILAAVLLCSCGREENAPELMEQPVVVTTPEATQEPTAGQIYEPVIQSYIEAASSRLGVEELLARDLNYMIKDNYGDDPLNSVGYLIEDLDGDGTPELLIGCINGDIYYNQIILEMYSIREGEYFKVFSSGERDRYYLCQNGTIAEEGSSGAADSLYNYYAYSAGELTLRQSITYKLAMDRENPWHLTEAGIENPIGEEEAIAFISACQSSYVTPKYTAISQFG